MNPAPPNALPTLPNQPIALGESVEVALDASIVSGQWYCEIGDDPAPCSRFVVDVPRAGTVVVRMEFDGDLSMFIQIGNLAIGPDLAFVTGGSPLIARAQVEAGPLPFRVGVQPWGRQGAVVHYRLVATLD